MISRRQLLIALGASSLAAPYTSFAQPQGKVWRIGFLSDGEPKSSLVLQNLDAFKSGMRDLGYIEGKDYLIEQRFAENDIARLPALAAELIVLKIDLILTGGTPQALAAYNATHEIPILIAVVGNPVGVGLAASLRRPGGNVTGLTNLNAELYSKRLDLLRQILPGLHRVGILYNPDNATNAVGLKQLESDCAKLGFKSVPAPARKAEEIAAAFNTLQRDKVQGLIVTPAGTNIAWRESIIEYAAKHKIPTVYGLSIFAESGGLLSYAANYADNYRRVAGYADKIFKGAKPGDLPIEQPTKFEMVINLKTAKSLGIKIPDVVMLRADKVIE